MGAISRFTRKMPNILQKGIYSLVPFRYRYGKEYPRILDFLDKTQWLSEKKLKAYQWKKLKKILEHAYKNVPYYRNVFKRFGIRPSDIREYKDFKKLPLLTKDIIRENYEDLKATNIDADDIISFSTSGSTGQKLTISGNKNLYQYETAFLTRAFASHGSQLYDHWSVWIRRYVPSKGGPLYKYDYELKRLYISAYHVNPKTIGRIVKIINSSPADTIVGYPSSLYIFSNLLNDKKLRLAKIIYAHCTSEKMPKEWKSRIESIMGFKVKEHYGMVEKVSLFHQCADSDLFHEDLEYGFTEIINPVNGVGDVIGTSLNNYAMPLIRYRTGDLARPNRKNDQCVCGRGLPLTVCEFTGRANEILKVKGGGLIPTVNFYPMMAEIPGVRMFKLIQHSLDKVEIKLATEKGYSQLTKKTIKQKIRERMGDVEVYVNIVKEIPRSKKTGKIKIIESMLK